MVPSFDCLSRIARVYPVNRVYLKGNRANEASCKACNTYTKSHNVVVLQAARQAAIRLGV